MIVTKPDGSTEDIPLYDFGTGAGDGLPVMWVDGVGVQQVDGTNVYGPGAVLTDDNGHWFQIGTDWAIRPMGSSTAAPATNPTTQRQQQQQQQPGPSSVGPFTPTNTVNQAVNRAANPTDPNVRAASGTASTLGTFFGQQLRLGQGFSIPYWLLAGGGAALLLHRRRRH